MPGTVWIGDDGLVEKVTSKGQKAPAGFDAAPRVDVGDAVVYPGLIDLHSHIGFNAQPLWVDPEAGGERGPLGAPRPVARGRHLSRADPLAGVDLINGAPESTLAYIQVRALAGVPPPSRGGRARAGPRPTRWFGAWTTTRWACSRTPSVSTLTDTRELDKRVLDLRPGGY